MTYYFKSEYTGQCFEISFIPPYMGWIEITKKEYEEYMRKVEEEERRLWGRR